MTVTRAEVAVHTHRSHHGDISGRDTTRGSHRCLECGHDLRILLQLGHSHVDLQSGHQTLGVGARVAWHAGTLCHGSAVGGRGGEPRTALDGVGRKTDVVGGAHRTRGAATGLLTKGAQRARVTRRRAWPCRVLTGRARSALCHARCRRLVAGRAQLARGGGLDVGNAASRTRCASGGAVGGLGARCALGTGTGARAAEATCSTLLACALALEGCHLTSRARGARGRCASREDRLKGAHDALGRLDVGLTRAEGALGTRQANA